jgi:hypothetical protein
MRRTFLIFALLCASSMPLQAADTILYDYCLKIKADKNLEFRAKNVAEAKIWQMQVDRGALLSAALLGSVVPTGQEKRCDYHMIYEYPFPMQGPPADPTDEELKKAQVTRAEFNAKRQSTGYIVNLDIWRIVNSAGSWIKKGDYVVFNFDKVKGPADEWVKLSIEGWQPVAQELSKQSPGTGWRAMTMLLPRGTGLAYDAGSLDIYPSWTNTPLGRSRGPFQEIWSRVHPNDPSMAEFAARRRNTSDRYSIEMYQAVEAIQQKNPE